MSRVSKSKLKLLIKECLVEILEEGISLNSNTTLNENRNVIRNNGERISGRTSTKSRSNTDPRRPRYLDNIKWGEDRSASHQESDAVKNKNFEKNVNNIANSLTSDPTLADILKDTAMTTLQEQTERGGTSPSARGSGDLAAQAAANSDPMEMFGGSSQNWAELAFADNKIKT